MTQSHLFTREQLDQFTASLTVENTLQEDLQTRKVEPFKLDGVAEFMKAALDGIHTQTFGDSATGYWVCECKSVNIHHPTSFVCLRCAAHADSSRKATVTEIRQFELPILGVDNNILVTRRDSLLAAMREEAMSKETALEIIDELAEIEKALQAGGYVDPTGAGWFDFEKIEEIEF